MSIKTVNISIADNDLSTLSSNGYNLCFSKMVDGVYTLVWQAYDEFYPNNVFLWKDEYKIFATNNFTEGQQVLVNSNKADIRLGQITTYSSSKIFSPAVDGGLRDAVNMKNEFGCVYPGLFQTCRRIDNNEEVCVAVFVMPSIAVKGTVELRPEDKLLIWFEQNMMTGTMINRAFLNLSKERCARSDFAEVNLADRSECSVKYENQAWKVI